MTKLPAIAPKKSVSRRGSRAAVELVSGEPAPLTLELPTPPSVNECFGEHGGGKGRRGRHETRVYLDWQGHALWRIAAQKPHRFDCPVLVFGSVDRMNASADIDNRIKPILDILKTAGVYADDKLVTAPAFVWAPTRNGMTRLLIVPACQSVRVTFHPANETGATGGWFLEPHSPEEEAA